MRLEHELRQRKTSVGNPIKSATYYLFFVSIFELPVIFFAILILVKAWSQLLKMIDSFNLEFIESWFQDTETEKGKKDVNKQKRN